MLILLTGCSHFDEVKNGFKDSKFKKKRVQVLQILEDPKLKSRNDYVQALSKIIPMDIRYKYKTLFRADYGTDRAIDLTISQEIDGPTIDNSFYIDYVQIENSRIFKKKNKIPLLAFLTEELGPPVKFDDLVKHSETIKLPVWTSKTGHYLSGDPSRAFVSGMYSFRFYPSTIWELEDVTFVESSHQKFQYSQIRQRFSEISFPIEYFDSFIGPDVHRSYPSYSNANNDSELSSYRYADWDRRFSIYQHSVHKEVIFIDLRASKKWSNENSYSVYEIAFRKLNLQNDLPELMNKVRTLIETQSDQSLVIGNYVYNFRMTNFPKWQIVNVQIIPREKARYLMNRIDYPTF